MYSNEDTDVKALVSMWLKNQPKEDQQRLEGWLEDFFYKALEWVVKQYNYVVDTTLIGTALNGLSHLKGVRTRAEFACALMRGLGGNMKASSYPQLAKEVYYLFVLLKSHSSDTFMSCQIFHWTHEMAPDQRCPHDTYYDERMEQLQSYQSKVSLESKL